MFSNSKTTFCAIYFKNKYNYSAKTLEKKVFTFLFHTAFDRITAFKM